MRLSRAPVPIVSIGAVAVILGLAVAIAWSNHTAPTTGNGPELGGRTVPASTSAGDGPPMDYLPPSASSSATLPVTTSPQVTTP